MTKPISEKFSQELEKLVGKTNLLINSSDLSGYLQEERGLLESFCTLVVRPSNTAQLSKIVILCNAFGISMVPLGGNTGLVGGGIADGGIIISLEKLNVIEKVDPVNHTMIVGAGCILANIQEAAREADCLFPLSLGAEGSCQIGGNLSTNAGGVNVLQYGNARDLVLGLEAVLPDGRIFEDLNQLRKNNTGYDLKQLFIGSEGTLGIITKAVLKLSPLPINYATTIVGLSSLDKVLPLFEMTRENNSSNLSAFELIPRIALDLGIKHIPGMVDPFGSRHPHYVLIELSSSNPKDNSREAIEETLETALSKEIITDAVIADNDSQMKQLWRIREEIPAAQSKEGGSIKHDISVPISETVKFIKTATKMVENLIPGSRICAFGHIGDGNIHFNITQPVGYDKQAFLDSWTEVNRVVHDLVTDMGGSISAEHGIGILKRDELKLYLPEIHIDLMRQIKTSFDPKNLMNPDKIFVLDKKK